MRGKESATTLWALLIPGPDDVWPMESKEQAQAAAKMHNDWINSDKCDLPVDLKAVAQAEIIEWTYGVEAHVQCLEDGESESI